MEENEKCYTVTEASKILEVTRQTLYHYISPLKERGEIIEDNSKILITEKGLETLKKLNIGKKFKDILPELLKDELLKDENGKDNTEKVSEEKSLLNNEENQNEQIRNIITPENFKELLKNFVTEYDYLKGRLIEEENKNREKNEIIKELNQKIEEKDKQIISLSTAISDFLLTQKRITSSKSTKENTEKVSEEKSLVPIDKKKKTKQRKKNSFFNKLFK